MARFFKFPILNWLRLRVTDTVAQVVAHLAVVEEDPSLDLGEADFFLQHQPFNEGNEKSEQQE